MARKAYIRVDRDSNLKLVFTLNHLTNTWRKVVRNQIRSFPLKDLFDYYDLNYNIESRSEMIINEITAGTYKPSLPLIYRVEKKYGVSRHVVHPQPIDSLILQVLTGSLQNDVLKKQPSKNAFYARDKHFFSEEFEGTDYSMVWSAQWKEMQRTIYKFNKARKYLVVTDLSNFYDNIDLSQLRRILSNIANPSEVLLDILFKLITDISWQPFYLPYSGRGLPTINIEGIRLLAHTVLFEIDSKLMELTRQNFVRWMDDIMFGTDSKEEAIRILSILSDSLNGRGHALNLAKTEIMSARAGRIALQFDNNRQMNAFFARLRSGEIKKNVLKDVKSFFLMHIQDDKPRYWDKITKRVINFYDEAKDDGLLNDLPKLYRDYPSLRSSIIRYLASIGFSRKSSNTFMQIVKETQRYDDLTLYELVKLSTDWKIPTRNAQASQFIKNFNGYLSAWYRKRRSPYDFYCYLWFRTKYDTPKKLLQFLLDKRYIWQPVAFLRRQAIASMARLYNTYPKEIESLLSAQIASGDQNVASVANQLLGFRELKTFDKKLLFYIFPKKGKNDYYPLSKFLVLCSVLNSEKINSLHYLPSKIRRAISDPYYLKHLKKQYKLPI